MTARALILIIKIYRNSLSRCMLHQCRFIPSCSVYAVGALEAHGLIAGARMTLGRLLRCHWLAPGGYDPVRS